MAQHTIAQNRDLSAERARRSMARRRLRVWLNVAAFIVITGVMVVLSIVQRDQDALRGRFATSREHLEYARDELQELYDQHRIVAPAELPLPLQLEAATPEQAEEAYAQLRQQYVYNLRYGRVRKGRVGVCYDASPHSFYLKPYQRHVLIFEDGRYKVLTLTEDEFQRQAEALGFVSPD
jgi:hypothetical protein